MDVHAPYPIFYDQRKGANGRGGLDCGKIFCLRVKGYAVDEERNRKAKKIMTGGALTIYKGILLHNWR